MNDNFPKLFGIEFWMTILGIGIAYIAGSIHEIISWTYFDPIVGLSFLPITYSQFLFYEKGKHHAESIV